MCFPGSFILRAADRKPTRKWAPATRTFKPEHLKTLSTYLCLTRPGVKVDSSVMHDSREGFPVNITPALLTARSSFYTRTQNFCSKTPVDISWMMWQQPSLPHMLVGGFAGLCILATWVCRHSWLDLNTFFLHSKQVNFCKDSHSSGYTFVIHTHIHTHTHCQFLDFSCWFK